MAKTPAAPSSNDAPSEGTALNGVPLGGPSPKGRPTPSRAEQEAARKRPLVADTKEARARAKADLATQREKARIGMANGEQRYLPARDQGPQRKFVRDWVDGGWHLGEAVMPAMVLVILATFLPLPAVQYYAFVGLWIFIFFVIGDMVITSITVKRAAKKKFGEGKVEKGLGWYAAMRTVQMRFLRLPKPQVKRGQKPV
ncbi:hypothetical protein B1729_08080 [Microbacterium sp. B35-04]|uniref:DUF3043 domain-containing protein n=1 Tax=unclassified Microbacterium TaxID=2609290 RepID=UPI0013D6AA53|nr:MULTISPECIES: DUF3043 domain-containing protein [unclassified Microbacterium]KAF2413697.1 hypothetical protein B1729_08080 [Microbacterium sp. B35-04]KAF2416044.1 hypothetical protein B2K11_17475 [Microbacterium sp. B35-30]